ncbi:unnamed protein product [Alopecurus aequalis]
MNRLSVRVPVADERQQEELRGQNLRAALMRATACVAQYLSFLTMHDDGFPWSVLQSPAKRSELSLLTVADGLGVQGGCQPGSTLRGRTAAVSQTFANHCLAATAFTTLSPTRAVIRANATDRGKRSKWDRADVCPDCGLRLWYGPCCVEIFCRHCKPAAKHRQRCAAPQAAVPVQPVYRRQDGRRPAKSFDPLEHPVWVICQHVDGHQYTLTTYYNSEDAHYFHRDQGIRFESYLFHQHSTSSWDWHLHLSFTVRSRSLVVDIEWEVRVADLAWLPVG